MSTISLQCAPALLDANTIYRTIQSTPHGGSEHGLSKYTTATHCGHKAWLDAQTPESLLIDDHPQREPGAKPNALAVGTLYHQLMEIHLRGQAPDEVWDCTDEAWHPDFIEALRLYRGYLAAWGSMLQRFGAELVATELDLPGSETLQGKVIERFGAPLTGRADTVIRITDSQAAMQNTKLMLEPGVYLHDFKTAGAVNSIHDYIFTMGPQGSAYLWLYNQMHPEEPATGIIFDVIYKHKELRKGPVYDARGKVKQNSSFAAYLQLAHPGDEDKLHNLVSLAKRNLESRAKNPAHCFSSTSPCKYFVSGECGGF